MDWLAELLNLPKSFYSSGHGGGVIQGSASEAIVTVMVAARERYLQTSTAHLEGEERELAIAEKRGNLVAIGSEMAHSSTQKATQIVGVKFKDVPVNLEDNLSMTGVGLQQVLRECEAEGLEPFYLTVTLGESEWI